MPVASGAGQLAQNTEDTHMQQCAITDVYANKCTKNLYALIDRAVTQDMSVMPWEKLNNILKS